MSKQRTAVWTLGERIRKAREDMGWDQADLARHVQKGRTTVAGWESNKHRPSGLELDKIAEVTGYERRFFVGDVPPELTIGERFRKAVVKSLPPRIRVFPQDQQLISALPRAA